MLPIKRNISRLITFKSYLPNSQRKTKTKKKHYFLRVLVTGLKKISSSLFAWLSLMVEMILTQSNSDSLKKLKKKSKNTLMYFGRSGRKLKMDKNMLKELRKERLR